MGVKYVDDFEFPSGAGFSGSAGKSSVKGYMRGGHVKKAKGGTVGVTTERGPKSKRSKNTMTKAAKGGSVHDKLYAAGDDMGYARGGQVKDTSGEFVQKAKPQDSMDTGVQPARKGRNQAEIEAGGTKRLKPKYKKGGGVHSVRSKPMNKAKGGLARASDLGRGAVNRAAHSIQDRQARVRATVDEALSSQRKSQQASPRPKARVQDKPAQAKPKPSKIYREDKGGVPTFTDVPKVGKRGAAR